MRGKVQPTFRQALELWITPRMRGKVLARLERDIRVGITPACAGKSGSRSCGTGPEADHPRMCGEKFTYRRSVDVHLGSPPHVRGKERGRLRGAGQTGITPACAGKS